MFRLQVGAKLKETSSLKEKQNCAVVRVGLSAVQPQALKCECAAGAQTRARAPAWSHAPLSPLEVLQVERGNVVMHPVFPAPISTAMFQMSGFKGQIALVYLINYLINNFDKVMHSQTGLNCVCISSCRMSSTLKQIPLCL